ncbi:efflux RND transporter permease subunit [Mariprofundus erugo]|uniref:Efflux RND transporter permease subunit n=1 Tax=Mariprofundus erugo TaxID=2528639 RepID=A0A5R9GFE8_9PROT|nr:efflux RND transporter permease subunit [Mariprofundus erugo]TLS65716.1 efflux RND transporter permease subunit [Mariprofundus erugo]
MKLPNLSKWAIRNQPVVLYLLLALLLSGIYAYFQLPQKEDPDFTFKVMTVTAKWPGATAREMEQQVTDRIELALQETPWLDNLSSFSKPGESVIFVTLQDTMPPAELSRVWMTARKKLADMDMLPEGVQKPVINDEYGETFGSVYAFTSTSLTPAQLAQEVMQARRELLAIAGVGKVVPIGLQPEKIYIEFSSDKFASEGIDPLQVAAILKAQNAMEPAGEITTEDSVVSMRVGGDFLSLQSIKDIGIPVNGKVHRLGDISYIYRGYQEPAQFRMRFMGKDAVGLAVSLAPGADETRVGHMLDEAMAHMRTRMPQGMQVHQVANQPQVVKHAIDQFMRALTEALLIVLAMGFVVLGWRAGLVVGLSIPLVMAGTFLLMKAFGIDLHRVSVGALIIAIGLLVDDAMITVEMMKVKLEQGWSRAAATTFAYQSTAFPMLTGTLITAAAFLPVGLAKSSAGEYTFSICAVVTLSLLVSWLVAVVFTPFIGYRLLGEHTDHIERQYHTSFYHMFRRVVEMCLAWRKSVVAVTVILFALAIAGFDRVEQQFFPPSERPELLLDVWLPEGTSFAMTETVTARVEALLAQDKDIKQYTSYIGGGSPRFYLPLDLEPAAINYAQLVIETRDIKGREAVLKRIRSKIDQEYPDSGVRIARLENGPPVGYPIQFTITGKEPDKIRRIADDVMKVVQQNGHTKHVSQDSDEPVHTLRINLDQKKARAFGISSQNLSRHLQMLLSGLTVSYYREGGEQLEIVMRADEFDRSDPLLLDHAAIHTDSGSFVPLPSIATIRQSTEEGIIWRLNRQPVVTVRADISDDVQAPDVSAAIDEKLAELRASLPRGYNIEAGGAMEESDKSTDSIIAVLPLMGFIILTLLMVQLRSFSLTALVLLTAPLGLIGVTASLLAFHVPFGFVAMLGMISLAGMIMRNSVILVDQIEQDMASGLSRYESIIDSTVRRARPILLTAAAAILAMIPLTSSVFWGPMAVVIMGGLFVATLLTLLFLPALYALWYRVKAE